MYFLKRSSNPVINERFAGKKLVRTTDNTFYTENGQDGFRVSNIREEKFKGNEIVIKTQNSVYNFVGCV